MARLNSLQVLESLRRGGLVFIPVAGFVSILEAVAHYRGEHGIELLLGTVRLFLSSVNFRFFSFRSSTTPGTKMRCMKLWKPIPLAFDHTSQTAVAAAGGNNH